MADPSNATKQCAVCSTESQLQCSRCQFIRYCSREHQQQHWDQHKSECARIARINAIQIPSVGKKMLIVGGAMFDMEDDFWLNNFRSELSQRSVSYDIIELKKKTLLTALCTNNYTSVVIMNIGSGGKDQPFFHEDIKSLLIAWTRCGGKLMLHGERSLTKVFNEWFEKPWCFRGDFYRRTQFHLHSSCASISPDAMRTLPATYNVKCCMLSDVGVEEKLYSPIEGAVVHSLVPMAGFAGTKIDEQMCPVAVGKFGDGDLVFFGDVNAESDTIKIIISLATL